MAFRPYFCSLDASLNEILLCAVSSLESALSLLKLGGREDVDEATPFSDTEAHGFLASHRADTLPWSLPPLPGCLSPRAQWSAPIFYHQAPVLTQHLGGNVRLFNRGSTATNVLTGDSVSRVRVSRNQFHVPRLLFHALA